MPTKKAPRVRRSRPKSRTYAIIHFPGNHTLSEINKGIIDAGYQHACNYDLKVVRSNIATIIETSRREERFPIVALRMGKLEQNKLRSINEPIINTGFLVFRG